MKTKEELNALKKEVETLNKKLAELTEDELKQVAGGWHLGDDWGAEGYFNQDQENALRDELKETLRDQLKQPLRDQLK